MTASNHPEQVFVSSLPGLEGVLLVPGVGGDDVHLVTGTNVNWALVTEGDDVTLVDCRQDAGGVPIAELEITNDSSRTSAYLVTISFSACAPGGLATISAPSWIGEKVTDTSTSVPSLRSLAVSTRSTARPSRTCPASAPPICCHTPATARAVAAEASLATADAHGALGRLVFPVEAQGPGVVYPSTDLKA